MWPLKWNALFKIYLLYFTLFVYLCIYELILWIWLDLTDHFCFSGSHEMCYWSKSSMQDSLGPVCRVRRSTKHMIYKWILCYLMRGEEWKIFSCPGCLVCLNNDWICTIFWRMKTGWKNSLCHLFKCPYGKRSSWPKSPGSEFTALWCILVHRGSETFLRCLCFLRLRWPVVRDHQVTRGVLIRRYPSSPRNRGVGKKNLDKMPWVEELQNFFQTR